MTREMAQQMVANARSLEGLQAVLEEIRDFTEQAQADDRLADSDEEWIDYSSLPTYGGAQPSNTEGVWSWDADNVLVGESMPFVIEPRGGGSHEDGT